MLCASLAAVVYMAGRTNLVFALILMILIVVLQVAELFRFVSQTNQKLTRFLESVRYSDFISGFTVDNKLGKNFRELNTAFNEVLEAFRKARSEKEEHWQYLNTVVQQVRTGILSYDDKGEVQLMNANARKFIGMQRIKNLKELYERNPKLYQAITEVQPGKSVLYKGERDLYLTIQSTELRIRAENIKLITLQNIQPELQRQELEAWQNLTRVLRHEIMNSITPISSLTATLKEILDHDLVRTDSNWKLSSESADDLREGLLTIENRSKSLIRFIDAYREYTSLPKPKLQTVRVAELIDKVGQFMKQECKTKNIRLTCSSTSEYLTIQADAEMIEQVLINLMKNAIEAVTEVSSPQVTVEGTYDETGVMIRVSDNGPGVIREALESIFVPFYTTKKTGSGIGLSLSRQIMHLHHGSLTVESEPHVLTAFTLRF
jgi:nitrogen fixation/metabolism regulation signal transduction histidine kinase